MDLKKFDLISTISSEFRIRSTNGGIFSVLTIVFIVYLFMTELSYNLQTSINNHVYVNSTLTELIEIEFDMTFHNVQCSLLYLDASDSNGQSQTLHLDRAHHVYKRRLDKSGHPISGRQKHELGGTFTHEDHVAVAVAGNNNDDTPTPDNDTPIDTNLCGDCYGAGDEGECCDTCEDVKRAYRRKGWTFRNDKGTVSQCKDDVTKTLTDFKGEGCNVRGNVELSAAGGNFHIAPGQSLEALADADPTLSFQDLIAATYKEFNISHTIHKFHFGKSYPSITYQLDKESRIVEDGYGMYQYYITIIPTRYEFLKGKKVQTNQFSVTEHMRHVNPGTGRGLPGVFFFYEISPLHVLIQESTRGWLSFCTGVSAVIGGVFVVMSLVDGVFYSFGKGGVVNRLG